jgi:hypothetical protein
MEKLDLTQYTKNNVKQAPKVIEAVIIEVKQMTGTEIFGASAYDPHKVHLRVTFENAEANVKQHEDYALYDISELDNRSKLGKFITKYGDLELGTKVTLMLGKTGFYEALLE